MKTPIYVIAVLAFILSSCSKENVDNDIINNDITKIDLREENSGSRHLLDSKEVKGSCYSVPLITSEYNELGSLDFTVLEDHVRVTFQTDRNWELSESFLSLSNCNSKQFPVDAEGNVNMNAFQYTSATFINSNEATFTIEKEAMGPYFCFAAYSKIIDAKGNEINVWAKDWQTYNKTYIGDCGVWNDEGSDEPTCVNSDDIYFFVPLKPETSGVFPDAGSNADSVTLSNSDPTSEGYVDIDLNFIGIPADFKNATLSISFYDLDLYTDIFSVGNKTISFSESFTLRDEDNKILAVLDGSHTEDGEFVWTFDLPDSIFKGSKLTLHTTFTANLELLEGNEIHVTNTAEELFEVSICSNSTSTSLQ